MRRNLRRSTTASCFLFCCEVLFRKILLRGLMREFGSARAARAMVMVVGILVSSSISAEHPGNPAQSVNSKQSAAAATLKTFQDLSKRADAARDAGQLDEAVKLYRRALVSNPKWTEGWWSLGTIHYDADRYAEAQLAFEKVVVMDPKQGTARAMLGLCEFELGQFDRSLRDIEASKSLGVLEDKQLRDVVAYHEAVLLQRDGRFEAAKEALSSLCRNGVRSGELAGEFGMVALRMRDASPPDATSDAGQVVQHVGRAACLSGAKEYDAAKSEFDEVIAGNPHFPLVHYAYACELVDARDIPGAVKEFETEIAEQPKSVLPRLHIAAAEYKVDSAAGLKFAQEVVQLEPKLPLGHYLLGLLLLDTGSYKDAVSELEIARKAFPHDGRIDIALATAYAHVGRTQDAARARAEFARKKQQKETAQSGVAITDAMDMVPKQ
jgi:tetratricopeptide (TPR) repeat protein